VSAREHRIEQVDMSILTRCAKPLRSTRAYEWVESFDFFIRRVAGEKQHWSEPFEPPHRTDLPTLDTSFDKDAAERALSMLKPFREEFAALPSALSVNGFFGPADVAFYWSSIRSRRPDTIIEVGSGYSSRVALRALAENNHGRLICIDPAPRLNLPTKRLTHIRSKVEEVDTQLISSLKSHDILFIDSSHTGDEVRTHDVFLNAMPSGVLVHYHDIDYPWERQYPEWNEDSVIADFLRTHSNWKVVVNGSVLTRDYLPQLHMYIPQYSLTPYRKYNALWLTKCH
jgi:predicted O-methyltransferase YrrM